MNTHNPLITITKETSLKNGDGITVTGEVFDHTIWPGGEPVFSMIRFSNKEGSMWPVFFKEKFNSEEMEKKVSEFCENVDIWVK